MVEPLSDRELTLHLDPPSRSKFGQRHQLLVVTNENFAWNFKMTQNLAAWV